MSNILTLLILNLKPISKTLSIAADSLSRTMSIRAEKAISSQRVSQFTNCAEFAAHDEGNGRSRCNMQRHGEWMPEKAICVTCMNSSPYHLIRWIAGWASLVFLGACMIDAVPALRYPCIAKKK